MSSRLGVLTSRGPASTIPDASLVEEATVTTTPTTLTDDVFVVLRDFDEHRQIGPVQGWQTATDWPQRGDRALVVQAEQSDYWFVGWTPAAAGPVWESFATSVHPDWTIVETPQVTRTGGFVHLRGVLELVGGSGTGSIIVPHATPLPARFQPDADRYCAFQIDTYNPTATLSGWVGQLNLYTDGELALGSGKLVRGDMAGATVNPGFLSGQTLVLDGLQFSI